MGAILRDLLAEPLTRGLDLDDPATTEKRRLIVERKKFLRRIYQLWYESLVEFLPAGPGAVLELGSGAGFLGDYIPGLISSEVFPCAGVKVVLDGCVLPLRAGSLRAIAMTNVLHHLPRCPEFLREATRALGSGGRILMIEPWVSRWSRWVYGNLHHEPFLPDAPEWKFTSGGPLSGANGALPWILFERDRGQFQKEFPELQIRLIRPMMPFSYLVSGGVSLRTLMPSFTFPIWRALEKAMQRHMDRWAMFALVVIERV